MMQTTIVNPDGSVREIIPSDGAPAPVPPSVTRYQFLAAIRAAGRATDFKNYHNGLSEAAKEEWSQARIARDSAMVEAARVGMSVTNNAIDTVFRNAIGYPE